MRGRTSVHCVPLGHAQIIDARCKKGVVRNLCDSHGTVPDVNNEKNWYRLILCRSPLSRGRKSYQSIKRLYCCIERKESTSVAALLGYCAREWNIQPFPFVTASSRRGVGVRFGLKWLFNFQKLPFWVYLIIHPLVLITMRHSPPRGAHSNQRKEGGGGPFIITEIIGAWIVHRRDVSAMAAFQ